MSIDEQIELAKKRIFRQMQMRQIYSVFPVIYKYIR